MLTRMLSTVVHVSSTEYNKLRRTAIAEVKRTNGAVDILKALEDAMSGSQSNEDDWKIQSIPLFILQ
jgi:hypothetical protein